MALQNNKISRSTATISDKEARYTTATQISSNPARDTSIRSSNVFAVSSSKLEGSIAIRTVPTARRLDDNCLTT